MTGVRQEVLQEQRYEFPYHHVPRLCGHRLEQLVFMKRPYLYLSYMGVIRDWLDRHPYSSEVVTLIETLEHVPPDGIAAFVSGVRRQVSDGGVLLLTVPSRNVALTAKHYQHFDAEGLDAALSPAFVRREIRAINRISRWTGVMDFLLLNRLFALKSSLLCYRLFRVYERFFREGEPSNAERLFAVYAPSGIERTAS